MTVACQGDVKFDGPAAVHNKPTTATSKALPPQRQDGGAVHPWIMNAVAEVLRRCGVDAEPYSPKATTRAMIAMTIAPMAQPADIHAARTADLEVSRPAR